MAHTKADALNDLSETLSEIRALPGIKEKGVGVFYLKSTPFLHFHDAEGARWAHVKQPGGDWDELKINFKASNSTKSKFFKAVKRAYQNLTENRK